MSVAELGNICKSCGRPDISCECSDIGPLPLLLNTNGPLAIKNGLPWDSPEAEALRQLRLKHRREYDEEKNKLIRPTDDQIERQKALFEESRKKELAENQKKALEELRKKNGLFQSTQLLPPTIVNSHSPEEEQSVPLGPLTHFVECGVPLRTISTFRPSSPHGTRLFSWIPHIVFTVVLLFCFYRWAMSVRETRQWMQANEVPVHVMTAIRERWILADLAPIHELDSFIVEWLGIDRIAWG